ncbi:MAG: hypothetical protein EXQ47_04290 [Bryobacterales bacterium]|nr:hypothetical protein [Bryobacterales bacterium]
MNATDPKLGELQVDSAMPALLYFAMQTFGKCSTGALEPQAVQLAAILTLLLAVMNFLHVLLLISQWKWYGAIEKKLLTLRWEDPARHSRWLRTHSLLGSLADVLVYKQARCVVIAQRM